jgi:hypothetical protein
MQKYSNNNNEQGNNTQENNIQENNHQENNTQDNNQENTVDTTIPENNIEEKKFTQKDIETIFNKRFERERMKIKKELETKQREEENRNNMSEIEKIKADLELEKSKNESIKKSANDTLIKSEVKIISSDLGIIDWEVAFMLIQKENIEIDDNGNVIGVKDLLDNLIKEKPYLIKNVGNQVVIGDNQNNNPKKPGDTENSTMNSLIRGFFK